MVVQSTRSRWKEDVVAMKTMKIALLAVVGVLVCNAAQAKVYEPNEVLRHAYDLEGKVIKVRYRPYQPQQVSKTMWADNIRATPESILIYFPIAKFGKYFRQKTPNETIVRARVEIRIVQNQYGAKSSAPVLIAVGR